MRDKEIEQYIAQQKKAYELAHVNKKKGVKDTYAPATMVHWIFRQVMLNTKQTLPFEALNYLLSDETMVHLPRPMRQSIYALSQNAVLKSRPDVYRCFVHHVGTDKDIEQFVKDQSFSWVLGFLSESYDFYCKDKREDYKDRIRKIQILLNIRIQQAERYSQLEGFSTAIVQQLSTKPRLFISFYHAVKKLFDHPRFVSASKITFLSNLLSLLAPSLPEHSDQGKAKLFKRLQSLMEPNGMGYEKSFELSHLIKGRKKTMVFKHWWEFAAISPNASEDLQQFMIELLNHHYPASGLNTLIQGEPLLLSWIRLGAYPAVTILLRYVKKQGLNLFYQHPEYGFDFRTQHLNHLESWIGACYDQNPSLEQAYSSIYMALVNFFVTDDETYLLETPSSPATKQARAQGITLQQQEAGSSSNHISSGSVSGSKMVSHQEKFSASSRVSKPWFRTSRSNSMDFVRTNPLRRDSQENHSLSPTKKITSSDGLARQANPPKSTKARLSSSSMGANSVDSSEIDKDKSHSYARAESKTSEHAARINVLTPLSSRLESQGQTPASTADHSTLNPIVEEISRKRNKTSMLRRGNKRESDDQGLADFIENDEPQTRIKRKRYADQGPVVKENSPLEAGATSEDERHAMQKDNTHDVCDAAASKALPADLSNSVHRRKRFRSSDDGVSKDFRSLHEFMRDKKKLVWPLQKALRLQQDQKTAVFFRGIHNQLTQKQQGLWAEACTLGDSQIQVQQQLKALSPSHRHLFQQVYTNDMDRFLSRVRSDEGLLGVKVSGRPFISTSTAIAPALDYALGRKWSGKSRKKHCLQLSYSTEGRPSHHKIGELYVIMMQEQQLDQHDWHHVMAMYARGAAINYRIVTEAEISHVAHIPKSCIAMVIPLTMPDFSHKSMPSTYEMTYGYQQKHYQHWRKRCQKASGGEIFAQQVVDDTRGWLIQSLEAQINQSLNCRVYPSLLDERLQAGRMHWHMQPDYNHLLVARVLHYLHLAKAHIEAWRGAGVSLDIYLQGFLQV